MRLGDVLGDQGGEHCGGADSDVLTATEYRVHDSREYAGVEPYLDVKGSIVFDEKLYKYLIDNFLVIIRDSKTTCHISFKFK